MIFNFLLVLFFCFSTKGVFGQVLFKDSHLEKSTTVDLPVVEFEFAYDNQGDRIRFESITSGCVCLSFRTNPVIHLEDGIPPGAHGVLVVSYNVKGFSGHVSKDISVKFSSPSSNALLNCSVDISPVVKFAQKSLIWKVNGKNEEKSCLMTIVDKCFKLLNWDLSGPKMSITKSADNEDDSVLIKIQPDDVDRRYVTSLKLNFRSSKGFKFSKSFFLIVR